jgi:4-alpha-glucanotransferase
VFRRSSGILLHVSSLPSPYGLGDLGPSASRTIDFLQRAGQTWWQMLPIGPLGASNSPYDSPSSFAGSPLYISLERLVQRGYLEASEATPNRQLTQTRRSRYDSSSRFRWPRLRKAFERFRSQTNPEDRRLFDTYVHENQEWLEDYALFSALRADTAEAVRVRGSDKPAWSAWRPALRSRAPEALDEARGQLGLEVDFHRFLQFEFDRQWQELRRYGADRGVRLLGDVPMFVAYEGSDVWANQTLFFLDEAGQRTVVAGVPPDYFSQTGQRWGNPLYQWERHAETSFSWFVSRMSRTLGRFDAVRLDHFIGFHRYWEIPASSESATVGRFLPAPGAALLTRLEAACGGVLPFVAEDLGLVTPEVLALCTRFHLPGMKVLQFAFGDGAEAYLPHSYSQNCAVYTGTHDNDTAVGWFEAMAADPGRKRERQRLLEYLGSSGQKFHWDLIRVASMSVADLAIFPLQDLLGLGSRARMNIPGTAAGNWTWRVDEAELTPAIAERMAKFVALYGRTPPLPHAAPFRSVP